MTLEVWQYLLLKRKHAVTKPDPAIPLLRIPRKTEAHTEPHEFQSNVIHSSPKQKGSKRPTVEELLNKP